MRNRTPNLQQPSTFDTERHTEEGESGVRSPAAITESVRKIGSSVTVSGFVTASGFTALMLSTFPLLSSFGLLSGRIGRKLISPLPRKERNIRNLHPHADRADAPVKASICCRGECPPGCACGRKNRKKCFYFAWLFILRSRWLYS